MATPLLLTRLGMLAERMIRAFWPLWSWLFVVWTALAFGLQNLLPPEAAYGLLALAGLGVVGFLVNGLREFRWPTGSQALERLDHSLKGRPISAIWDTQAIGGGDMAATRVWQAHMAAMAAQLARVRPVRPDLRISSRDPYGVRYIAATALVVALMFGSVAQEGGLGAILPANRGTALASGPAFEGWVEPPRYTGLPVIYLNDMTGNDPLPVPQGSKVTLRLYGGGGKLGVQETISGREGSAKTDARASEQAFKVRTSGNLRIIGAGRDARWQIGMIPDRPPMIVMSGPVENRPDGKMKLGFEAMDDYGVVSGSATIRLDLFAVDRRYGLAATPEPRPEIVLDIPLPLNGNRKKFTDSIIEDLSRHPWAGLPVTLTLSATDALGQTFSAEPETFRLPGRRFFNPLAAAIVEQRRDLLWNRKNAKRVAQVLRAISNRPEDIFDNPAAYLILQTAIRQIEFNLGPLPSGNQESGNPVSGNFSQQFKKPGGQGPVSAYPAKALGDAARGEIANLLWKTALLIENGPLANAKARLRRAQERLSKALKDGATGKEIAKLSDELRQAMQEYLQQLSQNTKKAQPRNQAQGGRAQEITSRQLQQLLDRIQELARQGRTKEARQLLEQLRQIMQNMQTVRRQQGGAENQQSMRNLQNTLRQQQTLSDEAFRQMQKRFNGRPGLPDEGGNPGQMQEGGQQPPTPDTRKLARRQDALRQLLEGQLSGLPKDSRKLARQALRRAERQMGQARDSLQRGDLPRALDDQANALQSLREGLKNLERDQARNNGQKGNQAGGANPDSGRDPLGRQSGSAGRIGSDRNLPLQGDNLYMRSRELRDEIRRRSGDKSRPRFELDYLNRLLDRF